MMENIRSITFKFEVFLEEILWIYCVIRTDNKSHAMLKHNSCIKIFLACRRKSKRNKFYEWKSFFGLAAILECQSQNCDVGKNIILQAFWFPKFWLEKNAHFLRFVTVNHPKKCAQKRSFSGCSSSRYQQQWQLVLRCSIKFFSQWRDCTKCCPKAIVVRFSKKLSTWTFLLVKTTNYCWNWMQKKNISNILCRRRFALILM